MTRAILDTGDTPADGQWYKLGYVEATSHKCDNCSFCSQYAKVDEGVIRQTKKNTRYLCGKCLEAEKEE